MLNKYRLIVTLLVYVLFLFLLYPLYKFVYDYDGPAYLSITKRLAAGDFYNAINGYWSPLHSWLALPLYKAGMEIFLAFRVVSMLAGAGILITVHQMLKKLSVSDLVKTGALFICIPVTLCYVYCFQAPDILTALFLLIYIHVMTAKDIFENPRKNILCGIIGCICYFAKTYAFPFFLAHFTISQIVLYRNSGSVHRKKWLARNLVAGIATFLLLASPWIALLYYKYHFITFGYSGKLNYNWWVLGVDSNTPTLQAFDPTPMWTPWEDPYYNPWNLKSPPPYTWSTLRRQLALIFNNIRTGIPFINECSFLAMAIIAALAVYAIKKKHMAFTVILLAIVILFTGYLPVAIGFRYLFTITFFILVSGVFLLSKALNAALLNKNMRLFCWFIFAVSFVLPHAALLNGVKNSGISVFQLAGILKENHVKGKLVANYPGGWPELNKITFITENTAYCFTGTPKSYEEMSSVCKENGLDYFFFYHLTETEGNSFRNAALYKNAVREIDVKRSDLIVIQLK